MKPQLMTVESLAAVENRVNSLSFSEMETNFIKDSDLIEKHFQRMKQLCPNITLQSIFKNNSDILAKDAVNIKFTDSGIITIEWFMTKVLKQYLHIYRSRMNNISMKELLLSNNNNKRHTY